MSEPPSGPFGNDAVPVVTHGIGEVALPPSDQMAASPWVCVGGRSKSVDDYCGALAGFDPSEPVCAINLDETRAVPTRAGQVSSLSNSGMTPLRPLANVAMYYYIR